MQSIKLKKLLCIDMNMVAGTYRQTRKRHSIVQSYACFELGCCFARQTMKIAGHPKLGSLYIQSNKEYMQWQTEHLMCIVYRRDQSQNSKQYLNLASVAGLLQDVVCMGDVAELSMCSITL